MTEQSPKPEEAAPTAEADLVIVGAGAKATAIAGKVHAINSLGLARVSVTIVERTEPAASWLGRNGMTSGDEPLAVPPIKDIGFPYRSRRQFGPAGDEIDAALLPLSWQLHSMQRGEYAPWVNSGSPPVRHRDYGEYLNWVLERATEGVRLLHGSVVRASLDATGERWVVDVEDRGSPSDPERHVGRALLLTGPGAHHAFPHDSRVEQRIFHCDSRRDEFARVPDDRETEIAIVGGGESALSALVFLRAFRPRARITVYTPMLPLSRGESFLENRVFADPDDVAWETLDPQTRRDFVKHCDRGVFDSGVLARIAGDEACSFVTGRVVHFASTAGGERVSLEYESPDGVVGDEYDFVVNSTGFDLLTQLHGLFPEDVRAEIESRCGPLWDRPPESEIRFGRALELEGMSPRLHIPGLAGLSQGPGFANLGSLGLLANRVLSPLLSELGLSFPGNPGNMQDQPLVID